MEESKEQRARRQSRRKTGVRGDRERERETEVLLVRTKKDDALSSVEEFNTSRSQVRGCTPHQLPLRVYGSAEFLFFLLSTFMTTPPLTLLSYCSASECAPLPPS